MIEGTEFSGLSPSQILRVNISHKSNSHKVVMEKTNFTVRRMLRDLNRDQWRDANRFSPEVETANAVLFHPYSTDGQKIEALSAWMQKFQPCLFGRIAAATNRLHYCILSDEDLQESDLDIAEKIRRERVAWKRRSLGPAPQVSEPAHGFVLAIASERVALASPDDNLYRLAQRIQDLWGCESTEESGETVHWETLFIENPADGSYSRFTFSVDFFAAQGDGCWWHDHRVPGGLAFTANSAGHMRRYREWYTGSKDQKEWLLQTAMGTIHLAAETPYGRATWLRPLKDGKPMVAGTTCPFANPEKLKTELKDKDWTRYGGHLHTDHSIRKEFFSDRPEKRLDLTAKEWLQDFTYLYDTKKRDHVRFIGGQAVSYDEIVVEIGAPEDYQQIVSPKAKSASASIKDRLNDLA